jgi:signal transduction histidine kinase
MRLRTRLLLALAYVVLLAIVAIEVPLALDLRNRVNAEVRTQADSQADLVAASAVDLLAGSDRGRLENVVDSAARSVRGRVIVVGPRGGVLADSSAPVATGGSFANRPEVAAALRGDARQTTRHSDSLGADLLATAVPIVRGRQVVGAVRITQGIAEVNAAVRRTLVELVLVGVAVLLMGLAFGALIAGQIARPLRRLERTAKRVAAGELDAQAAEEGSAEQRSLAASFNEMTARVRELLEAQRRFVADASHQLRTPLAGLRLRLEAARARHPGDRDVEAAEAEVERLARIVDDLLTLSRAGERSASATRCALADAARRAGDRFAAAAERANVELRVADEAPEAMGWCVPSELDRVLDALVENALLYGASGGEVEIAVRPGAIEVRDRGPGLAPDEEQDVFERFHRGSAARAGTPGTGLGLPIARTIARAWGGEVLLTARSGGGTLAILVVPDDDATGRDPVAARDEVPA